jgi:hypothetical protein
MVDGILTATGVFNESDPVAKAFADYMETHPGCYDGSGWGMSWRFYAIPNSKGVYEHIKSIVEFTALPLRRAANPYTTFTTEGIKKMLTEEQRKALELVLASPELVATVEQTVAARNQSKVLDEAGVQRKDADVPEQPAQEAKADAPIEAAAEEKADAPKCKACGHAMHDKACGVAGCDCGKPEKSASADSADIKAKVLTWGDLDNIHAFIKSTITDEQQKREADFNTLIESINKNLTALTEAVEAVSTKQEVIEAEEKALAEQFVTPKSSLEYLMALSAAGSGATTIAKDSALAKAAPAETLDDVFAQSGLK